MEEAQDRFAQCLSDVLGFSQRQVQVLVEDGYAVPEDLAYWGYDEIKSWVSHKEKIPRTGAGAGVLYGDMKRKSLAGLAWWVTERVRTGLPIDLNEFDDQARRAAILEAKVEHESMSSEVTIDKPEKFKYEDWPEWEKSVYTYFLSVKNTMGVPLVYVIRKPTYDIELDPRTRSVINHALLKYSKLCFGS